MRSRVSISGISRGTSSLPSSVLNSRSLYRRYNSSFPAGVYCASLPIQRDIQVLSRHRDVAASLRLRSVFFNEFLEFWRSRERRIGNERVERSCGFDEFDRRFFPTPGIPGRLSDGSPLSPR